MVFKNGFFTSKIIENYVGFSLYYFRTYQKDFDPKDYSIDNFTYFQISSYITFIYSYYRLTFFMINYFI